MVDIFWEDFDVFIFLMYFEWNYLVCKIFGYFDLLLLDGFVDEEYLSCLEGVLLDFLM